MVPVLWAAPVQLCLFWFFRLWLFVPGAVFSWCASVRIGWEFWTGFVVFSSPFCTEKWDVDRLQFCSIKPYLLRNTRRVDKSYGWGRQWQKNAIGTQKSKHHFLQFSAKSKAWEEMGSSNGPYVFVCLFIEQCITGLFFSSLFSLFSFEQSNGSYPSWWKNQEYHPRNRFGIELNLDWLERNLGIRVYIYLSICFCFKLWNV